MAQDYYQILGVSRSASDDELQKAYRKLARKHHPDIADDKEKAQVEFKKIQHAYDVLSDPKKRELYDQLGPNFEQYASAGGKSPFAGAGAEGQQVDIDFSQLFGQGSPFGGGGGPGGGGFEDILRQFGGHRAGPDQRRPQSRGPVKGQDIDQEITVPFNTAISGGQHVIVFSRNGKQESISVKIPSGIEDGKKIRLRGQGQAGPNGTNGDLFIKVRVAPHPSFSRRGNNLHIRLPVTVSEAALGAKIDVPTPHGTITLTVPPSSSSGRTLRMKGMGVKGVKGAAGDLLVELQIVIPDSLDEAKLESIRESLSELEVPNPRKSLSW